MTGGAYEHTEHQAYNTWAELQTHLRSVYKEKQSINFLQKELSGLSQRPNEDISYF